MTRLCERLTCGLAIALSVALAGAPASARVGEPVPVGGLVSAWRGVLESGSGPSPAQAAELDRFLDAKRLVFDHQWSGVRGGMERYLREYPSGQMRDEALYWLSRSLDALAEKESDVTRVVALKRSAITGLERLIRDFAHSPWCDDARALRVQIAGLLVVLGQPQYQSIVLEALTAGGHDLVSLSSAKLAALDAVVGLSPGISFATLTQVVRTDRDPALRKKAAVLLAQVFLDKATTTLNEVARNDRDADVRELARDVITRIASAMAPVVLAYSCLDARVTDRAVDTRLPEGRVTTFAAPPAGAGGADVARRAIERIFAGMIALSSNRADASDSGDPFASPDMARILSRSTVTRHTMGSFVVGLVPGSVRKTADRITGRAQFDTMVAPFEIGPKTDVVLVARRGDRVALMSLRMVPKPIAGPARRDDARPTTSDNSNKPARRGPTSEPVYCASFYLGDGLVIRSTRCSWAFDNSNIIDFGRSIAEIPGVGGKWTLTGDIQMVKSSRLLVAREATMVRPDGTPATTADEIAVPLGDPSAFTARGIRKQ